MPTMPALPDTLALIGNTPMVRLKGPSEGAGAEMRKSLGTAVFSGMLGVTVFGIFFTPVFYAVLERFRGRNKTPATPSGVSRG